MSTRSSPMSDTVAARAGPHSSGILGMGVLLSCGMLVFFGGGCILDPVGSGSFEVTGKVTLDGEPAVGWSVWGTSPRGGLGISRPQQTDSNGNYHVIATGQKCEDLAVVASPPPALSASVTPSSIVERGLCERNVIDFSFSSSSPP